MAASVILQNPKYIENLAAAKRAAACWGAEDLYYTGKRIPIGDVLRLPRELRMKDYENVRVVNLEKPFDVLPGFIPVCIELLPNSVPLQTFKHPYNAVYVFGPEDGSVSQVFRRYCHHFVHLPSKYCLNLAATVNIVLYDRHIKHASL